MNEAENIHRVPIIPSLIVIERATANVNERQMENHKNQIRLICKLFADFNFVLNFSL